LRRKARLSPISMNSFASQLSDRRHFFASFCSASLVSGVTFALTVSVCFIRPMLAGFLTVKGFTSSPALYLCRRSATMTAVNIIPLDFSRVPASGSIGSVSLREAIDSLIVSKRGTNRREIYLTGLRSYLLLFAAGREEVPVSRFSPDDLERWFDLRKEKPATRNSNLGRLSSLFEFARRRKWCPTNICQDAEKVFVERGEIKILSVADCRLLMERARDLEPSTVPYFALALFCGIRPDEIQRLTPGDISLARGTVTISSATSKTRRRRIVPINSTAAAWLELNCVLPVVNLRRKFRRVRAELVRKKWIQLIAWSPDVLRHTAASMLCERIGAKDTAKILGHSEDMLFSTYRNIVPAGQNDAFWGILPGKDRFRQLELF